MQNLQVIFLSVCEPTDKMTVPLIKKFRSILSNKRHCLKQAFQERTLPKVKQLCLRCCMRRLKDVSEIYLCWLGIATSVLHCALCVSPWNVCLTY